MNSFIGFKILIAASFLAAPSFAAEVNPCADLDEVDQQIMSCDDNAYAAEAAKDCSDFILDNWKKASVKLQADLQTKSDLKNQRGTQAKAKADYASSLKTIDQQIASMKAKTDLIASYTPLMIDFPDAEKLAESASCFSENFKKIDAIIWNLDEELIRARKLRAATLQLKNGSAANAVSFDGLFVSPKVSNDRSSHAGFSGQSFKGESDISGTKDRSRVPASSSTSTASQIEQEETIKSLFSDKLG